jgi:predicted MPP superfamily phosphohydrolase
MGQYQLDQTTLYVSRGLVMEGNAYPWARILCPPEVTVVELVPAGEASGSN